MSVKRITAALALAALCLALAATPALAEEAGHKIRKVTGLGSSIELLDGSVWRVPNPVDQEVAYEWLPFQDIEILSNGREMLNAHRGERVDVKLDKAAPQRVAAPSSSPSYSAAAAAKGGAAPAMAPAAPAVDQQMLEQIMKRLDAIDAKLQVMDWRIRQMENEAVVKPRQ